MYVSTTHCEICLVEFHTRARLLEHVKGRHNRPNICLLNYLDKEPVYTQEQVIEIDKALAETNRKLYAAAHRQHYAAVPCFSLQGPFLPVKYVVKHNKDHPLGVGYSYRS